MTDIITILNGIRDTYNIPYALDNFPTASEDYTPPGPPFIVYTIGASQYIYADNTTWLAQRDYELDLYTETKDPATEQKVEQALSDAGITYTREDINLPDDKLYSVAYNITTR